MRLVSLYIENFGGLSRYALDFGAGLTTINEPNGFGKTTLAEFIRAMLYGFPRKTKTLEKSRRQRYAPWGGGQYGGNLVFEHEGQRYRIERTFGATPKGDTFCLIDLDTNRKSNRFSEEIGVELFGLDSDSFERSTYLPQMREEGSLATAAIQARLSNLVEDSGDVGNYDKAIAMLKSKRSALIPYRGSGGAVAEASAMISRLQMQLDQAQRHKAQLEETQKLAAELEAQIEAGQTSLDRVRQELAEAAELSAAVAQQRQYQQLRAQHHQACARVENYRAAYPAGFPDEGAIQQAEAVADRWAILAAQPASQEKLQFPSQQEINVCRRKCEKFDAQQIKIRELQFSLAELMQAERQRVDAGRGTLTGMIIAWTIGALGLTAGAALMLLQEFLYGIIGMGIGAAAVTVAAALLLARRRKSRARKKILDEKLHAAQREITAAREMSDQYRRQIGQFLTPYFGKAEPQRFLACLTQLEHHAQLDEQARQRDTEAAECRAQLEAFFMRFGLTMEPDKRAQLRKLRADIRDAQAAQASEQMLAQQLAALEAECGDILFAELRAAADPRQLKLDGQRLRDDLTELTKQLLHTRQRVQTLREQVDGIGQLQEELARWQQKQAEDRENARILDDTMDFLQQARENLSTSYMSSIRARFGHYLAQLEGSAGERYFLDADFQVQLERMGCARELAYFSAGQTDLVMLCMRLALVDALFKGQEAFVILDDPFVNLDDAHTAQAQRLLHTLSRERQILYLTCHSSRAPAAQQ